MDTHRVQTGVAAALLALLVLPTSGFRSRGNSGRPTVFVAAVRDSRMLTMCPDARAATFANGRT